MFWSRREICWWLEIKRIYGDLQDSFDDILIYVAGLMLPSALSVIENLWGKLPLNWFSQIIQRAQISKHCIDLADVKKMILDVDKGKNAHYGWICEKFIPLIPLQFGF